MVTAAAIVHIVEIMHDFYAFEDQSRSSITNLGAQPRESELIQGNGQALTGNALN